jgi:Fe2+ or Zn2+ uptake regulation protein
VLDGALRARGARPTRQRRAIFSALSGRLDHPTAESLYRSVRRRVPGMALATVYTTLEVLVEAGLAGRFIGADGVAHYDARTDAHDHRRCLGCGRIDDLDRPRHDELIPLQPSADFQPTGYRIEVTGYCAGCLDSAGARREPEPTHEGAK